jgi:hypothetical protein
MHQSPIVNQRLAQLQFQDRVQESEQFRRSSHLSRLPHHAAEWANRASVVRQWWKKKWSSMLAGREATPLSAPIINGGD